MRIKIKWTRLDFNDQTTWPRDGQPCLVSTEQFPNGSYRLSAVVACYESNRKGVTTLTFPLIRHEAIYWRPLYKDFDFPPARPDSVSVDINLADQTKSVEGS